MTERRLRIVIDPSGAETGGRIVKRELTDVAKTAVTAKDAVDQLSRAQSLMAKSAQASGAAMTQQLDALRAKFNPTYATIQRYKQSVDEIRQAHRLGALSVNEMATALSRERQAALSAISAIKSYGSAVNSIPKRPIGPTSAKISGGPFETANIAAQFQDIAVTSAMGMSPLQIALQQGTQLSAVLGPMGAAGAVKGLGAAFTSLLNPVSLVTMGLVAGTSALIQYFSSAEEGTERVDTLLKRHAENIQALEGAYGIASEGLKQLAFDSRDTIAANAKETLEQTIDVVAKAARDKVSEALSLPASDFAGNINVVNQFAKAITELEKSVSAGKPDLLAFRDALSGIALSGNASDAQKRLANDLRAIDEEALKAAKSLPAMMETAAVSAGKAATNVESLFQRLKKLSDLNSGDISQGNRTIGTVSDLIKDITGRESDLFKLSDHNRVEEFLEHKRASRGLRELQSELDKTKSLLNDAAKTMPSDIFGIGASAKEASGVIESTVGSIRKVYQALTDGNISAKTANESIERIRESLYKLGGDHRPIDLFIDSIVNGSTRVRDLEASIHGLSQAILNIPNKVVSIGIRQYQVPSSSGGTTGVNVYGGAPDMTSQTYDVGGGKSVTVTGGNGYYKPAGSPGMVNLSREQILALSPQEYGQRIGRHYGDTYWDYYATYGPGGSAFGGGRATGGPVAAGMTYLVGEKGPELVTMAGAGNVTTANSTASILSGGRDTLSLIEDHLYNAVQELRIQTNYWADMDGDMQEVISCLKAMKSASASYGGSSYSGGSSSSGGSYSSSGSSSSGSSHLDPMSAYYFNASRNFAGRGGGRYDPVADALMNGNVEALRGLSGGPTQGISRMLADHNMPSLLDRLKKQAGFATGGQIMPGEDQRVEFFKKNSERVIIVDDSKVSDSRGGSNQQSRQDTRPIQITNHFHGDVGDARSRQSMEDQFRRAVQSAIRR